MAHLHLRLFGLPQVEREGVSLVFATRKTLALLSYLAVGNQPHHRDTLATLLWPESSQRDARTSLRHALGNLRTVLGDEWLETTNDRVGLVRRQEMIVDIAQFLGHVKSCQAHSHTDSEVCAACVVPLTMATTLYTGDFLAGFSLKDSPEFDEWHLLQREQLRSNLAGALSRLVEYYVRQHAWQQAVSFAQRWVALDPLYEQAQRHLIKAYAWSGQLSSAIRQYNACVEMLKAELGAPPEEETVKLYEEIRSRQLSPLPIVNAPSSSGSVLATPFPAIPPQPQELPRHNLPAQATPFVGRAEELSYIARCLADPTCRLLTIRGQGGMGKTRLAVRAAQQARETLSDSGVFVDGLFSVSLASTDSASLLASRIADALSFPLHGEADPKLQIIDYLRDKQLLLLLDNFEHLMPGVELLTDILAAAPGVKMLLTSREALNVQEEWLVPLDGLSFPADDQATMTTAALENYDAVRLFVQSTRRLLPGFSLAQEKRSVITICRLVEGMPLAIELATTWLKVLSCSTIATELEQGLDLFATTMRNVPARHRNMRAVFEQSWRLLSTEEATVMSKLAILRGEFRQSAAEAVADARLGTLATLVDKSLLRVTITGRYQIHELLRQYAEEKLAEVPRVYEEAQERHSNHYLHFLAQRAQDLMSEAQPIRLEEIAQEIDNIRAGWLWAVRQGKLEWMDRVLASLYDYYQLCSRYMEGLELFALATEALQKRIEDEQTRLLLGRLQARQGALLYALGQYEQARTLIEKSLAQARQRHNDQEAAFCLNVLGAIVWWQEDTLAAIPFLEESLALSRAIEDQVGVVTALLSLTRIFNHAIRPEDGRALAEEALAISRTIGYLFGIGESLKRLAGSAFVSGDYMTAIRYFKEGLTIFKQLGNSNGTASTLGALGGCMHSAGSFAPEEYMPYLEEAVKLGRERGNSQTLYSAVGVLGLISNHLGDYETGLRCGQELVNTCGRTLNPYSFTCLIIFGYANLGLGKLVEARICLQQGISTALQTDTSPHTTIALALSVWARLLQKESELLDKANHSGQIRRKQEQALEIATNLFHDPKLRPHDTPHLLPLVASLEAWLPPEVTAAARKRGLSKSLVQLAHDVLNQV
jgi:DNA-binding SARP family transcriptional activator/predicted ATPase